MKTLAIKMAGLMIFALLLIGCDTNVVTPDSESGISKTGVSESILNDGVTSGITQDEIDGLIHMRIEEKLARDAYIVLGELWDAKVFYNIQISEQTHMDAVKAKLDKFNIPDPLLTDEVGVFPDAYPEFQILYDGLMTQGSISLHEGLLVGVAIEEMDIADLEEQIELAANPGIIKMYTYLKDASISHLAAFNKNLIGCVSLSKVPE